MVGRNREHSYRGRLQPLYEQCFKRTRGTIVRTLYHKSPVKHSSGIFFFLVETSHDLRGCHAIPTTSTQS